MVAGLYITGVLIMPDVSRYCRNGKDVFWMVLLWVLVGKFIVSGIAMLVGQALGTKDVVEIMIHSAGLVGSITVVLSAVKVNDINLYSSSLSSSALAVMIMGQSFSFPWVAVCLGITGTLLSISGVLENFVPFLKMPGVICPPVAGVILTDYYILPTSRCVLEVTGLNGTMPDMSSSPFTGWPALIACITGIAGGWILPYGIPSLNSISFAGIVYWCLIKVLKNCCKK